MTLAGVLWGEAQGSPQPCSMLSSNIGVRHRHPQGMAGLGRDVLRPLLQNLGNSSIYAWIGSVEKIFCENEGILGENTPICLNKHGRVFFPSCLRGPKGRRKCCRFGSKFGDMPSERGGYHTERRDTTQNEDPQRGSSGSSFHTSVPVCFPSDSQVGRRCEGHTAGLFPQLFPWPARCK